MKGLGICEWSVPFDGEELFAWLKENQVDNVSVDFDYEACKTEEGRAAWCEAKRALAKKYGIQFSILAVNVLCTYGMNQKEHEDLVKDILEKAVQTAAVLGAPAIHMPSFGAGEIHSKEERDQVIIALNHACRLGEKYQIQVGYESPLSEEDQGYILDRVNGETFFVLFDNENMSCRGIDPISMFRRFQKYHKHMHIKAGTAKQMVQPLEEETSSGGIKALLSVIRESGFDGWVIIESEYNREPNRAVWEEAFKKDRKFILENLA